MGMIQEPTVEIYHPGLPGQPVATIPTSTLTLWQAEGWVLVSDPPTTLSARLYAGPTAPPAAPALGELVWLETDGDGQLVSIKVRDEQTEVVTTWPAATSVVLVEDPPGSGLYELVVS